MRKVVVRIGGLVAAASAALMLAGVSPAFASPAAKPVTGPEAISGAAYGKAAIANVTPIPLTFAGVVPTTDRGFVLGGGSSNTHTLVTPVGKLTVTGTGKQTNTQTFNTRTCRFTYTSRGSSSSSFLGHACLSVPGGQRAWPNQGLILPPTCRLFILRQAQG